MTANTTLTPLTPPTICVNGTALNHVETEIDGLHFVGSRVSDLKLDPNSFVTDSGPCTVTMTAPAGAQIRYTIGGQRNVNLGSPNYNLPITLYTNDNGFGGNQTTIKAKSYYQGHISSTTEVNFRIAPDVIGRTANHAGSPSDPFIGQKSEVGSNGNLIPGDF